MIQVLANAIIIGSIYALIAAGFNMVYSVQRFFYLAHGGILAVGAFTFHFLFQSLGISPFLSCLSHSNYRFGCGRGSERNPDPSPSQEA